MIAIGNNELLFDVMYFWKGKLNLQYREVFQDFKTAEEWELLHTLCEKETGNLIICTQNEQWLEQELKKEGFLKNNDFYFFSSLEPLFLTCLQQEGYDTEEAAGLWKIYSSIFYASHGRYLPCHHPLYEAELTSSGDVYTCCSAIMPFAIGNLEKGLSTAWHSARAKLVRLTTLNGTAVFCSKEKCERLKSCSDPYRPESAQTSDFPLIVNIAVDPSCNLSCPSCRPCVQVEGALSCDRKSQWLANLPNEFFHQVRDLYVAGNGEIMFSKVYRDFLLSRLPNNYTGNLHLLTNGQIYNSEILAIVSESFRPEILISVDAWTPETYEKLRRGGKHSLLMNNLKKYLSDRDNGKLSSVAVRFVVQEDNYKDIADFILGMRSLGVDRMEFTRLVNGGAFSIQEFDRKSLLDSKGNLKPNYIEYFQQYVWPCIKDDVVMDSAYLPEVSLCKECI